MNYVGCKGTYFIFGNKIANWFYMNYVGCKASVLESVVVQAPSFIWTMWDVKVQGK